MNIIKSGICMMNTVIKSALLACLVLACEMGPPEAYTPYRPTMGGDYHLQYEACGATPPHPLDEVLVCEEACCVWAWDAPYESFVCEEMWCCHAEECEWFLHYQECYE